MSRSDQPPPLSPETLEDIASILWMERYDPAALPDDCEALLQREVNSERAFGRRARLRLEELLANPESFTPDYSERYTTLIKYTESLTPHQAYTFNSLLGLDSSRGYQEVPGDISFLFPGDDFPQFGYQVEWHFFVGHIFARSGEEYGVQLMFWRSSILPPPLAEEIGLTDIENQIAEMHFAISRAGDRHYRARPYLVAGTTGLFSFTSDPFDYRIGKNSIRSHKPETLFPIRLQARGVDTTGGGPVVFEIDLTLNQTKGYALQGDQGLSPSIAGIGTLYYSVPNLRIDPEKSTLRLDGDQNQASSGKFWYDHQWGTGFMPAGNPRREVIRALVRMNPPVPAGWDWMAVQFDDNTEVTLAALHSSNNISFYEQTGSEPPGCMRAPVKGLYIDPEGNYSRITGHLHVTEWIQSSMSDGPYMATHTWYPNRIEVILETPVVPAERRAFTMIPIVQTGQVGFFASGPQYSEGAVYIETPDGERIGRGFLESTAYASVTRQVLHLAGLPDTPEMRQLITAPEITDELKAKAALFLKNPANAALLQEELSYARGL